MQEPTGHYTVATTTALAEVDRQHSMVLFLNSLIDFLVNLYVSRAPLD